MGNSSYPQGAFSFEEWLKHRWPEWSDHDTDPYMRVAFEAGYVSAVRHHDSAMRRLAEADPLEL